MSNSMAEAEESPGGLRVIATEQSRGLFGGTEVVCVCYRRNAGDTETRKWGRGRGRERKYVR